MAINLRIRFSQAGLVLLVTGRHQGMVMAIGRQRLAQNKKVFSPIITYQGLGHDMGSRANMWVAQLGFLGSA